MQFCMQEVKNVLFNRKNLKFQILNYFSSPRKVHIHIIFGHDKTFICAIILIFSVPNIDMGLYSEREKSTGLIIIVIIIIVITFNVLMLV